MRPAAMPHENRMDDIDIQHILKQQFQKGEGVLILQPDMPDEVILAAIRTALSYGTAFQIVPAPRQLRH